jgi:hypothetical protein
LLIPVRLLQAFLARAAAIRALASAQIAASERKNCAEEAMQHPFRFAITNGSQFALAQTEVEETRWKRKRI